MTTSVGAAAGARGETSDAASTARASASRPDIGTPFKFAARLSDRAGPVNASARRNGFAMSARRKLDATEYGGGYNRGMDASRWTAAEARRAVRSGEWSGPTAGLASAHAQANL